MGYLGMGVQTLFERVEILKCFCFVLFGCVSVWSVGCAHGFTGVGTHMWRPEEDTESLVASIITLCFILSRMGFSLSWELMVWARLASCPGPLRIYPCLRRNAQAGSYVYGHGWGPNSGPHACTASVLTR